MKRRARQAGRSTGGRGGRTLSALLGLIQGVALGFLKLILFIALIVCVSLSFLSLYNYLLSSPYMKIEQVEIKGIDGKIEDELIEMAGLDSNQNLLGLDLGNLKRKMETHPWIRRVRVERHFPHTLRIQAEKQVPAALVLTDGLYYVNPWGEIFKQVSPGEDTDLPIVTGLSRETSKAAEQLRRIAHVITVLSSEQDPWSTKGVSEIHLRKKGEVSIYFTHLRAEVRFMWNELGEKIEGLKRVADHLIRSGRIDMVTHINLNYEDGAVVSFRKG